MKTLIKPKRLSEGDAIATVSPSHGWAGDRVTKWKYELGATRLRELGLRVIAAPNSLRGSEYLSKHPEARADDIMWAFENKEVSAIIANMGGNDNIKIIPYIDKNTISKNPKIFIGYSDIMNIHLLCYHCGLSSFYGDNLLHPIADQSGWHEYSKNWFIKTLFDTAPLGRIEPSADWTFEESDYINAEKKRNYYPNDGCQLIQGKGLARGRLIGGHSSLMELAGTGIELGPEDFNGAILFFEDIPMFFDEKSIAAFLNYLGQNHILQGLNGMIIGKSNESASFLQRARMIQQIVGEKYACSFPILYGLNFGHSSPMFVIPYGALAEINCEDGSFSILESGVSA